MVTYSTTSTAGISRQSVGGRAFTSPPYFNSGTQDGERRNTDTMVMHLCLIAVTRLSGQ
jgi:hypothetical protein